MLLSPLFQWKELVSNVMYCYVRNALPRVRLVSLVRSCYVFLLPCYLGGIVNVQPFLQKTFVACSVHKRRPPSPNNLVVPEWNSKKNQKIKTKSNHVLVLVFLALVCFTLEIAHAQLIDTHSLTARSTQVSLCTCRVKKKLCLVAQTLARSCFFP
jgi:hypothetical protein